MAGTVRPNELRLRRERKREREEVLEPEKKRMQFIFTQFKRGGFVLSLLVFIHFTKLFQHVLLDMLVSRTVWNLYVKFSTLKCYPTITQNM